MRLNSTQLTQIQFNGIYKSLQSAKLYKATEIGLRWEGTVQSRSGKREMTMEEKDAKAQLGFCHSSKDPNFKILQIMTFYVSI